MQIGLIGGIGPAATDYYYRNLVRLADQKGATLDMTIVHTGSPTLLANLARDDRAAQTAIYQHLTERLVRAGAQCVVVTSVAGHFCIDDFATVSPLPVIDMLTEVRKAVEASGLRRLGILGTETVMASHFYGGLGAVEIVPPPGEMLEAVHRAYVAMAAKGAVSDEQRAVFARACDRLLDEAGAEAIMLAGTDLALVYGDGSTDMPIIDCAMIHVEAIARNAFAN